MALHLVAARLAPTGRLIVGGANDEGIRGIAARIQEVVTRDRGSGPRKPRPPD